MHFLTGFYKWNVNLNGAPHVPKKPESPIRIHPFFSVSINTRLPFSTFHLPVSFFVLFCFMAEPPFSLFSKLYYDKSETPKEMTG